jgi:MYXO-CTERM domain-containing protein
MCPILRVLALTVALMALQAHANPIFYEISQLSAQRWEYRYTVDNQTVQPIEQFTVWFQLGQHQNLEVTASPTPDWDGLAIDPDAELPDDGFADWLTFGQSIGVAETLSGFSVAFDWLGSGTPGSQFFEIIDAFDASTLSAGFTQPLMVGPPAQVSEPTALTLLGAGLLLLLRRRRSTWGQGPGRGCLAGRALR